MPLSPLKKRTIQEKFSATRWSQSERICRPETRWTAPQATHRYQVADAHSSDSTTGQRCLWLAAHIRRIKDAGHPVSRARVERLMRESGIRARHKRRYQTTTDLTHALPLAENYLSTLSCSTVGIAATPRCMARAQQLSMKLGSCNKNRRHNPALKVSEKQRQPHPFRSGLIFSLRDCMVFLYVMP